MKYSLFTKRRNNYYNENVLIYNYIRKTVQNFLKISKHETSHSIPPRHIHLSFIWIFQMKAGGSSTTNTTGQ